MESIQHVKPKNQYALFQDDILHWAAAYTGPKFHAIFCDPPYHLTTITKRFGKPGSAPAKAGVYNRASKGFMNQSWDGGGLAFQPETWAALTEHLYPGGFVMAFAGTRGYHRMACAMEDSGLIIHPSIFMGWCYLSGFPKATRIDKAIDRAAGAEREVIGRYQRPDGSKPRDNTKAPRFSGKTYNNGQAGFDGNDPFLTAPATKLAQQWAGHRYGLQALKPAVEPIITASKPRFDSKENLFYNEARDLIIDTGYLLEDLWTRFAHNAETISRAESEVNTVLNNVQTSLRGRSAKPSPASGAAKDSQDGPAKSKKGPESTAQENAKTLNSESKSPVSDAGDKSTNPLPSLKTTMTDTVAENVSWQTTKPNAKEPASIAVKASRQTEQTGIENTAQTSAATPPGDAQCSTTPLETATDTSMAMAILRYNSEKARLDLSTIWLWKLIWGDLCNLVNKSIIEMESRTTTELRTLNYSLRRLMLDSRGIALEKNSSSKLWSYATVANSNFIGLLTFLKIRLPFARNVNKSSLSPILVAQKPYEGRPIDNITQTGAGALNIDGSRIPTDDSLGGGGYMTPMPVGWDRPWRHNEDIREEKDRLNDERVAHAENLGRWPANLLLSHNPGCNGECEPDCPVKMLDEQSGITFSRASDTPQPRMTSKGIKGGAFGNIERHKPNGHEVNEDYARGGYNDSGGASRMFFQSTWQYEILEQLENAAPLRYEPKVSTAERNAGLEDPNHHPTLKPISLTKYLATLLLPPDAYAPRRICAPFSGAGSEMIGAILAGWDEVTGIEQSADYVSIAEARLAWWSQWPGWGQTDVDKILAAIEPNKSRAVQMELF